MDARLRRGLFGYSRKSVTAVVNDREVSITKASSEAKEAEDQVAKLTAEIDENRREIVDLQARNRDLDSKLEDAAERFWAVEPSGSTSTTEELTDVLHAAERALARLSDRARENAEQQLGDTERVRDSLRSEIDRLAAWRARMAPLADSILLSIEEVRRRPRRWQRASEKRSPPPRTLWTSSPRAWPTSPSRPSLRSLRSSDPSPRMTSSHSKRRASNPAPRCPMPNSGPSLGPPIGRQPRAASSPRARGPGHVVSSR